MKALQEAKVNMYRAVEKHCDDNAAIVASVPAFQTAVTEFKANIAALLSAIQQEDLATSGITIDKTEAKKTLCQLTADTAAQVFAFASTNNNFDLKQVSNFSLSELLRTRDDQLGPRCQNIYDKANANLAALAPFGVTAGLLTSLQTAITLYETKVPSPRNAAAQKRTIRTNIKNLLKDTDTLLKERMDKTAVAFRSSDPDFYKTYKSNRVIIDPSAITTELSGTVTNQADGSFITGATISIGGPGGVTATTNSLGVFEKKPAAAGMYDILFTAKGFADKNVAGYKILLGKNNVLDVAMVAV
jgi:hypothetical protein